MNSRIAPAALLAAASPRLADWREAVRDMDAAPSVQYASLVEDLVARGTEQAATLLQELAPSLEQLLAEYDADDSVSIGFIEDLAITIRDRRVVGRAIHDALGPSARDALRGMWLYVNQSNRQAVQFNRKQLGPDVGQPAQLRNWLLPRLGLVSSGTPVASLDVAGRLLELRCQSPSHIEQLVAQAPGALSIDDLLLYVLPDVVADLDAPCITLERGAAA